MFEEQQQRRVWNNVQIGW